ncbi:Glycosyltransferase Family 90 domain containing protein [Tulasnella sp. 403]|nr:Glycosyltransferase Family 90 domain containing protein [Tulasnella sp. 403]
MRRRVISLSRLRFRRATLVFLLFVTSLICLYLKSWLSPSPSHEQPQIQSHSKYTNSSPRSKGAASSRPKHQYREDGLLVINPNAPHPVYELILRAEREWATKHEKASRTLRDAVTEYKRRYGRPPPKGFDVWWEYVTTHNVPIPDEYDRIHHDLQPFWGIDPSELQKSQSGMESTNGTFTIASSNGKVSLITPTLETGNADSDLDFNSRAKAQLDLLLEVQASLPDFRATFRADDQPGQFVSHDLRTKAIDAAMKHKTLDPSHSFENSTGWAAGCPPTSPLRQHPHGPPKPDIEKSWSHQTKSFIHDHKRAMNPCDHPSYLHLNGFLQAQGVGPAPDTTLMPSFAGCSTSIHSDIITVADDGASPARYWGPVWQLKKHNKLHWRDSNYGADYSQKNKNWHLTHRIRFVEAANSKDGEIYVMSSTENRHNPVGGGERVDRGWLNEEWLDVKFAGPPVSCEKGPGKTCQELEKRFDFELKWDDEEQEKNWKYLIDIDGFGCSSKFARLVTSKSLIFKSTIHSEWFVDRVQPWLHYVPVKIDYTDLYDLMSFFVGDISGQSPGHDDVAARLAMAANKWSLGYLRKEDKIAYMFRLFLEYARVMSPSRETMNYDPDAQG